MATSTRDLLTGLAQTIADSSIAVYRPNTPYQADETAITFTEAPQSPDRCIMLTCVPITDGAMIPLNRWMVQFYFRGSAQDPMDVEDLGDAVYDLLQGATHLPYGTTEALQILRQGSVGNGRDASKRFTRIDRYLIDVETAPTASRPFNGWD